MCYKKVKSLLVDYLGSLIDWNRTNWETCYCGSDAKCELGCTCSKKGLYVESHTFHLFL